MFDPSTYGELRDFPRELPEVKKVEVMRLGEEGYEILETYGAEDVLRSPRLEGLEIKLTEIF